MSKNNETALDDSKETASDAVKKKPPENNLIVRSLNDPNSRKKAIYAQCFMCIGGTEDCFPDSGWRSDIGKCKALDCCLIRFRRFQQKPNNAL